MKSHCLLMVVSISMISFVSTARADLIHATSVADVNNLTDTSYYSASMASDGNTGNWLATVDGGYSDGGDYFAQVGTPFVLRFDLAKSYQLSGASLWNYPISGNEVKTFSLAFSTDGVNYGSSSTYTTATPKVAAYSPSTECYEQDFSFSTVTARYVQMTTTDNWYGGVCADGNAVAGGNRVGFNEIEFAGRAVPEPAPTTIVITGMLSLMAYAWRKRW